MKRHDCFIRIVDKPHCKRYLLLVSVLVFTCNSCKNQEDKPRDAKSKKTTVLSQEAFSKIMMPRLKQSGKLYRKYKNVYARKAVKDEKILTITSDGLETSNTAKKGDFIVKNQTSAREMYIIGNKKFNQRYRLIGEAKDGFSEYKPLGKVVGLVLTSKLLNDLGLESEFEFMAPWGEKMVAKKGDYIVCHPDFKKLYRIARKEFFETYDLYKE